jgi:hypothetical protein
MPREIKRFDIRAINPHGVEIKMTLMERAGALTLCNGLGQTTLLLPTAWTWQDMESEVKRVSGITRMVMTRV